MNEPLCELFGRIVDFAEVSGRTPFGLWDVALPDDCRLKVNGSGDEWDHIPPYHALFERRGWPAALVSPFGGTVIGADSSAEDWLIALLDRAIAEARR